MKTSSARTSAPRDPRAAGKESLLTANRRLSREWHPTRNGSLTPKDVTPYSNRKVWWVCRKGHEWEAAVYSRSEGSGCPYCAGNRAGGDNSLAAVRPDLAKEWHPTKNVNLRPRDVTAGSKRKVWWRCKKGHEWETKVHHRNAGSGCPYCRGIKTPPERSLVVMSSKLCGEWHSEKNGTLRPEDVLPLSNKTVWWRCGHGHEWKATVADRYNRGDGCPYCSGRRVCDDNCLATLNPVLAREWHPARNGKLTPKDVTCGSGRRVWWKCDRGHEWEATVDKRAVKGTGCPHCVDELRRLGFYAGSGTPGVKARARKRASGEGKRR